MMINARNLLLAILLLPSLALADYVQGGESSEADGDTTVTLTGAAAGNYLVAFGIGEASSGSITFSTTAGTTSAWTQVIDQEEGVDFAILGAAYATVSTTGDTTVQAAQGFAQFTGLIVVEVDSIDVFDSAQYAREDTADAVRTTALTTPGAYPAIVVGFAFDWGLRAIPAATTGWTGRISGVGYPDGAGTDGGNSETRQYSSGDAQASFDSPGAGVDPVFVMALILQETSGGGGGNPLRRRRAN